MPKKHIIKLDLLEPMEGSTHPAGSSESVAELFDYLENEFNNHGHRVYMNMIEEDGDDYPNLR